MENEIMMPSSLIELPTRQSKFNIYNVKGMKGMEGLGNIFFPVEMRELYYEDLVLGVDNEHLGIQQVSSGYKGVIRTDTNECLYAGTNYEPVYNIDIMKGLQPFIDAGFEFDNIRNYNNRRFEFNLINPNVKFDIGREESILRIKILNSYDGSQAFQIWLGAYIIICSNGLVVGNGMSVKRKHTGELGFDDMLKQIKNNSEKAIVKMQSKEWDKDQQAVKKVFETITKDFPDKANGDPNDMVIKLNNRYMQELRNGYEPEFALMMATTYLGTHGHTEHIAPSYQQMFDNKAKLFFN